MNLGKKYLLLEIGPNGGGKKTIAGRLSRQLQLEFGISLAHIESGEICRRPEAFQLDAAVAAKLTTAAHKGDLADDDCLHSAVSEVLGHHDHADILALDGYPRKDIQFDRIEGWANDAGRELLVVFVNTPIDCCLKRMRGRGRIDDQHEAKRLNRIFDFVRVTCPLVERLRERYADIFIQIDGTHAETVCLGPILDRIVGIKSSIKTFEPSARPLTAEQLASA